MERINLPTLAQGGFVYTGTAVLFRRRPGPEFEVEVVPWYGPAAVSWRNASVAAGALFRLGQTSGRLCGFW
jgi:hypothetical protein